MNRRVAFGALASAIIGGTLGALLTWYALSRLQMEPGDWVQTLGLVAVVVGWLVAYEMTIRAQRAQVRDQVVNEGRLAVMAALERQREAVNYAATAMAAHLVGSLTQQPREMSDEGWRDVGNRLLTGGMSVEALRAYEQVFPRTRLLREELSNWQNSLYTDIYSFVRAETPRTREHAEALFGRCGQLLGYLDELRVHVQNEALSEIMGVSAARVPRVGYTGTLIIDALGNLHLP